MTVGYLKGDNSAGANNDPHHKHHNQLADAINNAGGGVGIHERITTTVNITGAINGTPTAWTVSLPITGLWTPPADPEQPQTLVAVPEIAVGGLYAMSVVFKSFPDTPAAALADVNFAVGSTFGDYLAFDQSLAVDTATYAITIELAAGEELVVSFDNGVVGNASFTAQIDLHRFA